MNKLFPVWAVVCLCLASCHSAEQKEEAAEMNIVADTLLLNENSPINSKLQMETIQLEPFSPEFRTVGTVRAISGHIAEIAAPFDGRVMQSFVRLGQQVGKGTALFELNSSDFYEASKTYFQAKQNNALAQKNYTRKKDLLHGGVASERDVEEASTEAENAAKEFEQAAANLRIFNVDPESFAMGQPLKVTSPIAGEVVKCDITIGQFVKTDSEPLATVADLSKVWVVALVKEKYFGAIHNGDKAEVYTDAQPDKIVWGSIYHIGEMLDEETRSVEVLVECDNKERDLKPGMFTAVHFLSSPVQSVVIPSSAVFQTEDVSYVFVKVGERKFVRRPIEAESMKEGKIHVVSGLFTGETIVSDGGIYLTE